MNLATSGTYTIHQTEAEYGTAPKNVKPACGQSVSRSYLTVVEPGNEEATMNHRLTKLCKKCFDA